MALSSVKFFAVTFCIIACSNSFQIEASDAPKNQHKVIERFVRQLISEQFADISLADVNANECFAEYNQKQIDVSNQYEEKYDVCEQTAEEAKKELSEESAEKREETLARGESICDELSSCEVHNDGREFFQCYSKASSKNTEPLYQISSDTNKEVTNLNAQYSKIESDEKLCTDDAFDEYLLGLSEANKELQNCLNGIVPPTATAPDMLLESEENEFKTNFHEKPTF